MLSASRCREQSGLAPREVVAMLSLKQKQLFASYHLNLQKGESFVFELMVSDIQGLVDIGAQALATDVRVVLRIFMRDRPQFSLQSAVGQTIIGVSSTAATLAGLAAQSGVARSN